MAWLRAMGLPRLLATIAVLGLTACTSTVIGTGPVEQDPNAVGGSGTGSASDGPSGTATGSGSGGTQTGTDPSMPAGDPGDYESLFAVGSSSDATAGALPGVYSANGSWLDVRVKIRSTSVTVAVRCESGAVVGVDIAASVTSGSIRLLESKSIAKKSISSTSGSCLLSGLEARPITIPACVDTMDLDCFVLDGTTLSFRGAWLFSSSSAGPSDELVKLHD